MDSQQYYIKAIIDDKQLIKASVDTVGKAFDFYIIDVKYNIRPKSPGIILDAAKYLGIHGAVKQDGGKDYVDTNFLAVANNKVWEYLAANQKTSTINVGTETPPPLQSQPPQQPQQEQQDKQEQQTQQEQQDLQEQQTQQESSRNSRICRNSRHSRNSRICRNSRLYRVRISRNSKHRLLSNLRYSLQHKR